MNKQYIDDFIKMALFEDLGVAGDITSNNIFDEEHKSEAFINYREESVVGGLIFAKRVFEILDSETEFTILKAEGEIAKAGENVAVVKGKTRTLLSGERLALNLMQRISGIASNTLKYAKLIESYKAKIVDTRKTTPLFRYFEKYAVKLGGGTNHRFALYDAVMIKDNHIAAAGSIKEAVDRVRKNISFTTKIEVEVEDIKGTEEALEAKADIIMLDNIRGEELVKCVELINGRAIIEASGNINYESIEAVAKTGVDIISSGSIIYNAKNIDIGFDFIDSKEWQNK